MEVDIRAGSLRDALTQPLKWLCAGLLLLAFSCGLAQGPLLESSLFASVAPAPFSPDAYVVKRGAHDVDLRNHTWEWIDTTDTMTLQQVLIAEANGQAKFLTSQSQPKVKNLQDSQSLWVRFRLAYAPNVGGDHAIYLPLPFLDKVTFYVREPTGVWTTHSAGDTVAIAQWPERTRFPVLRLQPVPGQERLIYLQIHQGTRATIPVMLDESSHFNWDERFGMLVFGGVTGGLVLLTLVCMLQGLVFRDTDFVRLAGFCLLMTFGLATYMGVTPLLLGGRTDVWADASQAVMFCLIASSGLFLVRLVLLGSAVRTPFLRIAQAVGWLGVPLAVFVAFAARPIVANAIAAYVAGTTVVAVWACVIAWRGRQRAALWLSLAFLPMIFGVVVLSARLLGFSMPNWLESHAMTIGTALHLPLLVVAMNLRARDKHMAQARALALETQDALTGLLAGHLFEDRVARAFAAGGKHKRSGAVVLFKIGNFPRLRAALGASTADRLLLSACIRMRRVITNSDNLARLGDAEFGLLLDDEKQRALVQELCARLVALGLMPLKGLPKGISLNFQCVVQMLSDTALPAADVLDGMRAQLSQVSSRTRRPIRFMEALEASVSSGQGAADGLLARTAAEQESAQAAMVAFADSEPTQSSEETDPQSSPVDDANAIGSLIRDPQGRRAKFTPQAI